MKISVPKAALQASAPQVQVKLFTDGACLPTNPGPGGWAAVLVDIDDKPIKQAYQSWPQRTTNQRMELCAAIYGLLLLTPKDCRVAVYSDSQYLVKTMTLGWRRNVNQDLWELLDRLALTRKVYWQWVKGHAGNRWNEEADQLANRAAILKHAIEVVIEELL